MYFLLPLIYLINSNNTMKHKIFIATMFAMLTINSFSQVKEIQVQAAGLTCSMCSKAIFKALTAVSFIKEVKAEIKTSSYTIYLKDETLWDFDAIKNAVTGAGFSVAHFSVKAQFSNTKVENDTHTKLNGKMLHILNTKTQTLNGEYKFDVLDKNYVTAREFKANSKFTSMKCYQTGTMETCCSKAMGKLGERVYHITLKS